MTYTDELSGRIADARRSFQLYAAARPRRNDPDLDLLRDVRAAMDALERVAVTPTSTKEPSMTENRAALTTQIVSAYVGHNALPPTDLARLIGDVHGALKRIDGLPDSEKLAPAVPVAASIKPDRLVCLHCGKSFRTLQRHLDTAHGQTPDEYRAAFELPRKYPMVSASYSAARAAIAKGIRRQGQKAA